MSGDNWLRKFLRLLLVSFLLFSANLSLAYAEKTTLNFTAKETAWIKSNPVIKIGVLNVAAPYEYVDKKGRYKGIASTYFDIVKKNTGLKFEIVTVYDWYEAYSLLQSGKIDILPFAICTDLFNMNLIFSKPYISSSLGIFSNSKALYVNSLNDLEGKKVAIAKTTIAYVKLSKVEKHDLIIYDNVFQALKDVNSGKIDFYVGDIFHTKYILDKLSLKNTEFVAPVDNSSYSFGVATMPKDNAFISIFNKILHNINVAERSEIRLAWINNNFQGESFSFTRYKLHLITISIIFIIIMSFILYRNAILKKQARRLREKNEAIKKMNQAQKMESIGRLAGGVAHDFNNMLAGINGAAEALDLKLGCDNPHKKYTEIITNACERAAYLTSQLLVFARDKENSYSDMNLHECILESIFLLEHGISKNIITTSELKAQDYYIHGNRGLIQNIILNLGFNAKDAMNGQGNLEIKTRNAILSNKDIHKTVMKIPAGKYIELSVKDYGNGMPKHIQNKIFEPFFTTKEIGKGTGLGLSAVYGIVLDHGGTIRVESIIDQGTTFYIYFPIVRNKVKIKHDKKAMGSIKAKVMVVDDEKILLELMSDILKMAGSEVIKVSDSTEAADIYRKDGGIDIVMLDVLMPEKNGVEVYKELKSINQDVKVVFMSGYSKDNDIEDIMRNDSNVNFISKPYMIADVVEKLLSMLAKD